MHTVVEEMKKTMKLISEVSELKDVAKEARSMLSELQGLDKKMSDRWSSFQKGEMKNGT